MSHVGRKLRVGAAAAALLALAAAGCGSSSKSSTGANASPGTSAVSGGDGGCKGIPAGPIKVGNILPLSNNPYSQVETLTNAETSLDVAYFNAHDSICGHPIKVVTNDDKGDPATSLGLARQYVSDGIKIMMNPSLGPNESAIQPYLMQHKVLIVGISGITRYLDPSKNPSYFSVLPNDRQYAAAVAGAIKKKGWNDVGILNDGTDFGSDITPYLQKAITAQGLKVTKTVNYSPTAVDLTAPLQQLKQAGAQTVTPASSSGITALVSGMKQLGWPAQTLSWGAYATFFTPAKQLPTGTVDGCTFYLPSSSSPSSTAGLSPTAQALLTEAQKQLGASAPDYGVINIYVELQIIKAAVEKAGSLDSGQLVSATESLRNVPTVWPGISESFSSSDHTGYPDGKYGMCNLTRGPLQLQYAAPGF